ncbi:MAG: haloalkane dehalogenase [Ktedonobacterales bacterium]
MISAAFPYQKRRLQVLGSEMTYVEVGEGDPIVLLHGNPTSSYLWRNVLPHLQPLGRCIAPDLIGMGDSDKLPDSGPSSYRFVEHRRYLDALLEGLGVRERVTLVIQDWGSALGFDWANRHRDAVRGIAYFESLVRPIAWDEFSEGQRSFFQALRSPAGEAIVLQQNLFLEQLLPGGVLRKLSEEEMTWYRRPFLRPGEDRRPILTFARQLPIDGEPADVTEIVSSYADWLSHSSVPKLFINGEPGAILTGSRRDFCRTWPTQREVTVRGLHFLQEDSPDELGQAIAGWLPAIREGRAA